MPGSEAKRMPFVPLREQIHLGLLRRAAYLHPEPPINLTEAQRQLGVELILTLVERFGVKPKDFSLIRVAKRLGGAITEIPRQPEAPTLVYSAPHGIEVGDLRETFNTRPNSKYIIKVNGVEYDIRSGMTKDVYRRLVNEKALSGEEMPDSRWISDPETLEGGGQNVFTKTLLTGEKRMGEWTWVGSVPNDTLLVFDRAMIKGSHPMFRIRPAIVLPTIEPIENLKKAA